MSPAHSDQETSLLTKDGKPVIIRRSTRRRRTVSAFWEDGKAVVSVPAHMGRREGMSWVHKMLPRLESPVKNRGSGGDDSLQARADALSAQYLGGRAKPRSVRWVSNQKGRWGSATPAHGTIRMSRNLEDMPSWVQDYVLLHELAHLLVAGHGPDFWRLLEAYPRTETAKAFLSGVSFATSRGLANSAAAGAETQEDREEDVESA